MFTSIERSIVINNWPNDHVPLANDSHERSLKFQSAIVNEIVDLVDQCMT